MPSLSTDYLTEVSLTFDVGYLLTDPCSWPWMLGISSWPPALEIKHYVGIFFYGYLDEAWKYKDVWTTNLKCGTMVTFEKGSKERQVEKDATEGVFN